jgi:hypothetical protein
MAVAVWNHCPSADDLLNAWLVADRDRDHRW